MPRQYPVIRTEKVTEATVTTDFFTVATGKTFILKSFWLIVRNSNVTEDGQFAISENNTNVLPGAVGTAVAGQDVPHVVFQGKFEDHGPAFASGTAVRLRLLTGTLKASGWVYGLEMEN